MDHQNNEVTEENQDLLSLMVRLYNQLPLPFQCQVLTSTTVNYFEVRRQEHINEGVNHQQQQRENNEIEYHQKKKNKQTIKYNLMHHSKQLIESVEQVENLLTVHNILPVSKQCRRLINKQNAFCKIFKLTVERTQNSSVEEIDAKLRETIPGIVERYARSNGIKIGLSLIDDHWVSKLPSLIFMSVKEVNSTSKHYVFHCKLFLALGNTGPINGNLALSALYDYGQEHLSQTLGLKVDFSVSIHETNIPEVFRSLFPKSANQRTRVHFGFSLSIFKPDKNGTYYIAPEGTWSGTLRIP